MRFSGHKHPRLFSGNEANKSEVRAKKHFGQHFLRDDRVAERIVLAMSGYGDYHDILEVGPGTGVLTRQLLALTPYKWFGAEIDTESADYILARHPELSNRLYLGDFLKMDPAVFPGCGSFGLIGNFPYNISSQILFRLLAFRHLIPEMVGMFQKEVALRIASPPGNKVYGILSVLLGAFYEIELLFHLGPGAFDPPPKVDSSVIRLKRRPEPLVADSDSELFFKTVKMAFGQRRKTLRNALRPMNPDWQQLPQGMDQLRAERLGVDDFYAIVRVCRHDFLNKKS